MVRVSTGKVRSAREHSCTLHHFVSQMDAVLSIAYLWLNASSKLEDYYHRHHHQLLYSASTTPAYRDTFKSDMELGQWVTGSMGHFGHLSRPGHHYDPVWDPSFSGIRKNAQNAKRTFEMLKWQKSLSGVCCWTEITGCQPMQWTFTFTYGY